MAMISEHENNGVKKGPWTAEEDEKLARYIEKHGKGSWRTLPKKAGLNRCGKSCRLRWTNYLRPDIKRGKFSDEEEQLIIRLHSTFGNKWSKIAAHLPGRTDNEIKNHWNTKMKKKLPQARADVKTNNSLLPDLNTLANLSQLLSTSNPYHPMNPFSNFPLLFAADAFELARLQLVLNLLKEINPISQSNNLGPPASSGVMIVPDYNQIHVGLAERKMQDSSLCEFSIPTMFLQCGSANDLWNGNHGSYRSESSTPENDFNAVSLGEEAGEDFLMNQENPSGVQAVSSPFDSLDRLEEIVGDEAFWKDILA